MGGVLLRLIYPGEVTRGSHSPDAVPQPLHSPHSYQRNNTYSPVGRFSMYGSRMDPS